jgi:hypothetical protein
MSELSLYQRQGNEELIALQTAESSAGDLFERESRGSHERRLFVSQDVVEFAVRVKPDRER